MFDRDEESQSIFEIVFPALVNAAVRVDGEWRYAWMHQAPDTASGIYDYYGQQAHSVPRFGLVSTLQQINYATEINNVRAPLGRLYWMRYKSDVSGMSTYEFCADDWLYDGERVTQWAGGDLLVTGGFTGGVDFYAGSGAIITFGGGGSYWFSGGGGAYFLGTPVEFRETSFAVFDTSVRVFESTVLYGQTTVFTVDGPTYFTGTSVTTFEDNSTTLFRPISTTTFQGTVTFEDTSTTTFEDNSTVNLETTTWELQTGDTWTVDGDSTTLFLVNSPSQFTDTVYIEQVLNYDVTTFTAITTNQPALPYPTTVFIRLPVNSPVELQGIIAPDPEETTFFVLTNVGDSDFVVKDDDPGATDATYAIKTPGGLDYTISPGDSAEFMYDTVSDKWRLLGTPQVSVEGYTGSQTVVLDVTCDEETGELVLTTATNVYENGLLVSVS